MMPRNLDQIIARDAARAWSEADAIRALGRGAANGGRVILTCPCMVAPADPGACPVHSIPNQASAA